MTGKFNELENIPGWQGYMEKIMCEELFDQSRIIYRPFMIAPPSDYDNIYTSIMLAVDESKGLNIKQHLLRLTSHYTKGCRYSAFCSVRLGVT